MYERALAQVIEKTFIYQTIHIHNMDINQILAKAKEIGHDEVPIGGGNNSEAAEVLGQIFNASVGKFFKSTELSKLLNGNGVQVDKIGNVLFAMKNAKKCSQVRKGVYVSYNTEYDGHITASASASTE